ncbi:MAG: serine/threonine protein kinase [Acidobacteria bacterium]|nr:serine/threonine protein kinase [Acidobacteriota bacterium]
MGEVYRARDTKLDRDVALKILPESFANDPDRLMRFEREAKALASLNHPNIAAIYGIEESGAQGPGPGSGDQCTRALVMELVEGEDLSGRIGRGAMSLGDALALARQIADALAAAHEKGIVHRDLKPANVMVTRGGASEGARLRTGDARDRRLQCERDEGEDPGRNDPGHGPLHVTGAGAGPAGRPAHRPVCIRHPAA